MAPKAASDTSKKTSKKSKAAAKLDQPTPTEPSITVVTEDPHSTSVSKSVKSTKRRKEAVETGNNGIENVVVEEEVRNRKKAKKVAEDDSPAKMEKERKSKKTAKVTNPKKATKVQLPSPEPEPLVPAAQADDQENEELDKEAASADEDEDDGYLHGFSTDDDDSSDDEDMTNDEPSAFDIGKLPTIAKDDATVKRKLDKAKRQPTEDRGVLYLGRLPHGFYEDQLKGYFSQFGDITRLRVSRNKRTGHSKHCAFIEFDSSSVAQIVSETMDNYLLMGHILRCKVIPKDEVHPELWVGANRKWRGVPMDRVIRVQHNKPRTGDEQEKAAKRLIKRQNNRKRKLEEAGIKYNFEAIAYKKPKAVAV